MVDVWHRTLVDGPRRERLQYLYDRGLWHTTIVKHRLGHTGDRFVIPLRRTHHGNVGSVPQDVGTFLGVKLRADPRYCDPDSPKYIQKSDPKTVVYRPNQGGDPVVICEGEFDALVLSQLGCDAITSTGGSGSLAKTIGPMPFNRPVYIATDMDDSGNAAARELAELFPTARRVRWTDAVDVSERLLMVDDRMRELRGWIAKSEEMNATGRLDQ